jgi:hypothetical protein
MKYWHFTLVILFCFNEGKSQNTDFEFMTNKKDTLIQDVNVYGCLVHQHQDFFNKAFSFQGVEAGVILNQKLTLALYSSVFASALQIKTPTALDFIAIKQGSISVGYLKNNSKVLHTGWLLNTGYFVLTGSSNNVSPFEQRKNNI